LNINDNETVSRVEKFVGIRLSKLIEIQKRVEKLSKK